MTDSIDKKSNEKRDNLDVDLDAMLDEAESSLLPMDELHDDEDAIDRLLMSAGFDADDALMQAEMDTDTRVVEDADLHDELDDFLGIDGFDEDFNRPEKTQAVESGELEQTVESLPVAPLNEPQDDEDAIDRLLMNAGFDADDALMQSNVEDDASAFEALDDFSDFSDFNEPDITAAVEADESEPVIGNSSSPADDAGLADEIDEFSGFDGFGDDFDESELIRDDEVEVSAPVVADSIPPNEDRQTVVEESDEAEDTGEIEALDDFSDFSDFNEPDITAAVEADESEPVTGNSSSPADDAGLADEIDEFSGFDGFGDDFDESDLIRDDEADASAAPNEEKQATVEESFKDLQDDENSFDNLFADGGFDAEEALEQTDGKTDELSEEVDDFDESDLILDDEVEASAAPNEEKQATVEESFKDLQDDENSFDNLFADGGFDAEEALEEQTPVKEDEFGDNADVDDFFQLEESSNDFSKQIEEAQSAETEKASTQEDDFLLPDFDITADTEMSDMGGDAGIKEDEFADTFGDTDFLNEDETVQTFEPETTELKSVSDEAVVESESKQAADTAIEDIEKVKLELFEFEREEMQKQLDEAEKKVKKAKLFSYVALGFGAVALSAATGLGVMTYAAKSEVSKLTEAVSSLEASLAKNVANTPNEEMNVMRNSVVQLNQQVNGFITELKGNPQFPVDLLNNKVPDIVAKQDMVSKALDMLQVKIGGEGKASLEPSVVEPPKVEAVHEPVPVKEEPAHEIAPVKTEAVPSKEVSAHEPAPSKEETAHKMAPTKERAMHETAPAKVEAVPETAPVKVKAQPEAVTAKPVKPVIPPKAVFKEEPIKEKRPGAIAKWGVNLVAFKQEWFAKSKAAEFARQGIFAEVIPVREKNTTMYRLRVGGFKTKAEANANTARIKQTLNLGSVWVSDN